MSSMSVQPLRQPASAPNTIVYNYHGDSVIVLTAGTYQAAIDTAIQEFPRLKTVDRDDITLSCRVTTNGKQAFWRVSPNAWVTIVETLGSKSVLTVGVRGEDAIAGPASNHRIRESFEVGKGGISGDAPPSYLEVPDQLSGFWDKKRRNESKSRSPSPSGCVLSNPARSFSRSPSPNRVLKKSSSGLSGLFRKK